MKERGCHFCRGADTWRCYDQAPNAEVLRGDVSKCKCDQDKCKVCSDSPEGVKNNKGLLLLSRHVCKSVVQNTDADGGVAMVLTPCSLGL